MVGPNFKTPSSKVEENWVSYKAVSPKPYGESEIFWWKKFDDPTLVKLIEIAYQNNPTLQAAGVKILQERALLDRSIGNLLPQQQGISGGYNFSYVPQLGNIGGSGLVNGTLNRLLSNANFNPYNVSNQFFFNSTWEIDFWGKYRRKIESDKADYLASVTAYDNALVTIIGDIAQNYIHVRMYGKELEIVEANVAIQKESLRIATVRFQGGQTSQLDVTQAETELNKTEASIPRLENSVHLSKDALAVLLGVTPSEVNALLPPGKLPTIPSELIVGIPKDLLRRRPDVRSAGLKAASKSALIGVEITNLLPAFTLGGTFGSTGSTIGTQQLTNIFNWQNTLANAATGLTMPVFNYGRLVNQVRVADAVFQQAILDYQNTVLVAQKEVEDGLSSYYHGRESMEFFKKAVIASKESVRLAMVRYKEGQTDYTTVLTAEQQQLSVEDSCVVAQAETVLGIISTYRSLGGGWELRNGRDVISNDVKKQMADRTYWGRMLKTNRHIPAVAPENVPVKAVPKTQPPWDLLNVNKYTRACPKMSKLADCVVASAIMSANVKNTLYCCWPHFTHCSNFIHF